MAAQGLQPRWLDLGVHPSYCALYLLPRRRLRQVESHLQSSESAGSCDSKSGLLHTDQLSCCTDYSPSEKARSACSFLETTRNEASLVKSAWDFHVSLQRLWNSVQSPRQEVLSFYQRADVDVLKAAKTNCWLWVSALERAFMTVSEAKATVLLAGAEGKQLNPDTVPGNERWMGQNSDQFPLPTHCPRDVRSQGLFPFLRCPLFCPSPLHSLPCDDL